MAKELKFKYEVRVAGEVFFTGDRSSMGIIFNNLDGSNFDRKRDPAAEHKGWLQYMTQEYGTALPIGAQIEVVSPRGKPMFRSSIGFGLPKA